MTIIKQNNMIY